jgi:hypothetical protein
MNKIRTSKFIELSASTVALPMAGSSRVKQDEPNG